MLQTTTLISITVLLALLIASFIAITIEYRILLNEIKLIDNNELKIDLSHSLEQPLKIFMRKPILFKEIDLFKDHTQYNNLLRYRLLNNSLIR